jgi:hypothetical protein
MYKEFQKKLVDAIESLYFFNPFLLSVIPLQRVLGLILVGIIGRIIPHPPNFTPTHAIALFGICIFKNVRFSFVTTFLTMIISDFIFGFHTSLFFVYLSLGITIFMGYGLQHKKSVARTTLLLFASSFAFFLISNFGVWFVDSMYLKNISGLVLCYIAALPFFVNHMIGTFCYGSILYAWFALISDKRKVGLDLYDSYSSLS